MDTTVAPALREFLRWLDVRPRTYAETMDAWRTSCPRLSLWEDASIAGFVTIEHREGDASVVLTPEGNAATR